MLDGNTEASMRVQKKIGIDEMGSACFEWVFKKTLVGWLDLLNNIGYNKALYNAKIQESSHIFICDYEELDIVEAEAKLCISGKEYEVLFIDDPMNRHEQLEIYLKYTGD